jgi:hypothetical protein
LAIKNRGEFDFHPRWNKIATPEPRANLAQMRLNIYCSYFAAVLSGLVTIDKDTIRLQQGCDTIMEPMDATLPMAKFTTRITSAEFGDWHYVQLLCWAFTDKKQSKGTLLRDIGAARVEDVHNRDVLTEKLQEFVKMYRLNSIEELRERVLQADKDGITLKELHRQLAKAAGVETEETIDE